MSYAGPNVWICLTGIEGYIESTNGSGKDVALELVDLMKDMFADVASGGGCPNGWTKALPD